MLIRAVLIIAGSATLLAAIGIIAGVEAVTQFWPYFTTSAYAAPGSAALGRLFVASILAAIAAPVIWIGLSSELAAVRPGALNLFVSAGGLSIHAFIRAGTGAPQKVLLFGVSSFLLALAVALMFLAARQVSWRDRRPTPRPVRLAFIVFTAVLTTVGGALVLGADVFPWRLERDIGIAYGLIFIGAAMYFLYGVIRPVWGNAKGQLVGFLAYDLVLIVPYATLWPASSGTARISLAVYLAVLIVSALLAIHYLFLTRNWRFGTGPGTAAGAIAPAVPER